MSLILFAVAQNLQNIIQEQIQTLSTGGSSTAAALTTSASSSTVVTTSNASASTISSRANTSSTTTNGLLYGVPPPPPPPTATATAPAPASASTTSAAIPSSTSINSNAQAALMILLTAQTEPSLLQNPQVVSILQTLVNNSTASAPASNQDNKQNDINELLKDPSLASVFNRSEQQQRPALLDTPKTTSRPILLGNAPQPQQSQNENHFVDNNLLNNTQSLTQLLGSLNSERSDKTLTQPVPAQQPPQPLPPPQPQQPLLANPPPPTSYSGYYQAPQAAASVASQRPVLLDGTSGSLMGFAPYSNQFLLQPQQPPPQQLYMQPQQMLLQGFPQIPAQQAYIGAPNMAAFMGAVSAASATSTTYTPTPIGYHPTQTYASSETSTPPPPPQTQGLKRRINIPCSPEQSPEGTYVGQHSQGLGGHYASSYFSKKAKKY